MGTIVSMIGKDWWLSKTSKGRVSRDVYPDVIRVGKLGRERVYRPEPTCREAEKNQDGSCFGLSHVGDDEPIEQCKRCPIFGGERE